MNNHGAVGVKEEPTFMTEMEEVFIARGWKPPGKSRRRSRSMSPTRDRSYKGRKNRLGDDGKPLKCFICKCSHVTACTCPCVYHLAGTCPERRNRGDSSSQASEKKPDLGLFMTTNIFPQVDDDDSLVL